MQSKIIKFLENNKIAILGFGLEGKSTYNFIRKHNKQIELTIIDKLDVPLINDENIRIISGDDYLEHLDEFDIIIKTPGVSLKDVNIENIQDKLYSQLELFLMFNAKNVIGITGTKGKSTTTTLIYNVLKSQLDNVYIAGNIGIPVFDILDEINDETIVVLEMSSHQLEFINVSPHIGIVLNLYEDHLDHAGTLEHYHECKMHMFDYQNSNDIAIYCSDNKYLEDTMNKKNYKQTIFKVQLDKSLNAVYLEDNKVIYQNEVLYVDDAKRNLLGKHNLENIMVVLLVSKLFNLDLSKAKKEIDSFKGLPNRLELVGEYDDITYYCDTIATIPEATISGMNSLENVDTLIFGGMDRGIDYQVFIQYLINSNVSNLICMPTTGYKIGKEVEAKSDKNIIFAETLEEAVTNAKKVTAKGSICLLSPAASSYEYYKNFMEKGDKFKELVRKNTK
ncbi:MAG: UDP-N-acetylmuramoyl-L-alanine--D-glutamate ligase [Bacilli bacterium]